ncbi:MAG: hypothetical protein JXR03_08310 [Cyclobacteriaceae bacterium]
MRTILIASLFLPIYAFSSVKDDIEKKHEYIYTLLHSNPDLAFDLSVETEELAGSKNLPFLQANSIYIQAWILKAKRLELGKSFQLYLKALEIIRPIYRESEKSTNLYLDLLVNTANILTEYSTYEEAKRYYDLAIETSKDTSLNKDLAWNYWMKSRLQKNLHNYEGSLSTIELALNYAKLSKDERMIMDATNEKGIYLKDLQRFDEARNLFYSIVSHTFVDSDEAHFKGMAWHNIAHSYYLENEYEKAEEAYAQAEKYKINHSDASQRFITWTNMSELYLRMNNLKSANEYGLKALDLYKEIQLLPVNYQVYELMSTIAYKQGYYEKSRDYTEKFIEENDKFLALQHEIQQNKGQYKMELLVASFFLEVNAEKNESIYSKLVAIISSVFSIILLAGIFSQYRIRRSISKSILNIEKNSLH